MAQITNPVNVSFANNRVRPFADAMLQTYNTAKAFIAEYTANNLAPDFAGAADVIVDGSATDGRYAITAGKVTALASNANAIITWFETGSPNRADILRTIAVNGGARF